MTTSLFAALDHRFGKVIGTCYPGHLGKESRSFLAILDEPTDPAPDLHLVLDNPSNHKAPTVWH